MVRQARVGLAALAVGCAPVGPSASDEGGTSGEAVASTGDAESTGGSRYEPTAACVAYLECVAAEDPDGVAEAEARYGSAAACWAGTADDAEACDRACADGYRARCGPGAQDTGGEAADCSLQGLAPGVPSPLEIGDGDGDLPRSIAEVLERQCGCHLAQPEALPPLAPAYLGTLRLRTHADFHAPFKGQPAYAVLEHRAIAGQSMPPVYYCGPIDAGGDDFTLLAAWLAADAPDAASWSEPR